MRLAVLPIAACVLFSATQGCTFVLSADRFEREAGGADASFDALGRDGQTVDGATDGGAALGDALPDATLSDAVFMDAPGSDGGEADSGTGTDAAIDAFAPSDGFVGPDAFTPPDACVVGTETCNGRDDNCDGTVDEADVCQCTPVSGTTRSLHCITAVTWSAARDACAAKGLSLAVPRDNTERLAYANAMGMDPGTERWLGFSDIAVEGEWRSVSGELLFTCDVGAQHSCMLAMDAPVVQAWAASEPNTTGYEPRSYNCAGLRNANQLEPATYNDQDCNVRRGFFCD